MNKNWPTKLKDIDTAQQIIESYAQEQNAEAVGLFELIFDEAEKRMDFRLSSWVMILAEHFKNLYGPDQGDFVTRQILSAYMTQGHTVH